MLFDRAKKEVSEHSRPERHSCSNESVTFVKELPNFGHGFPRSKLVMRSVNKVVKISSPFQAVYIGQNIISEIDICLLLFPSFSREIIPTVEDADVPGNAEIVITLTPLSVRDDLAGLGPPLREQLVLLSKSANP